MTLTQPETSHTPNVESTQALETPQESFPATDTSATNNSASASIPNNNGGEIGASSTAARPQHINRSDNEDDNQDDTEEDNDFVRQWKASPFAVGYTKPTWADEGLNLGNLCTYCCCASSASSGPALLPYLACTACLCQYLPVGRLGNLVVLRTRNVEIASSNDPTDNNDPRRTRPKLVCVVGPYFLITLGLTLPALLGLTGWTGYRIIWKTNVHVAVIVIWAVLSFGMIASLLMASCSDPGVLYRYEQIPPDAPNAEQWLWNDQALTYRPPKTRFDPETQVMVEHFDHTCPWVGTAIGKGNMVYFQRFLIFLGICLVFDIVLLTSRFF